MTRFAVDSNLLVYAEGLERSSADAAKIVRARLLFHRLADAAFVIPAQALSELHNVLVRKALLGPVVATDRVRGWAADAETVYTDWEVLDAALGLAADHRLVIFDAIILAAAARSDCDLLVSEDLQDGFAWRGVVVANPFAREPEPRLARLLAN